MKPSINIVQLVICSALGVGAYFLMQRWFPPGPDLNIKALGLAIGWGGSVLIGLIGLAVVYRMFIGSIDLTTLVSETDGKASVSRFQLLIFTFVISLSLLLITVSQEGGPKFPTIPPEILGLLGISAGSYVVSKSLKSNADGDSPGALGVTVSPASLSLVVGQSSSLTASGTGTGTLTYEWQKSDAAGTTWQPLAGQTKIFLNVTGVLADNGIHYRCKISDSSTSAFSASVPVSVLADRG